MGTEFLLGTGGQMKVVAFIEPPQGKVVEKILRGHQSGAMVGGLWQARAARAPPEVEDLVLDLDVAYSDSSPEEAGQFQELTYVDIDTFLASFSPCRCLARVRASLISESTPVWNDHDATARMTIVIVTGLPLGI
jgi:hypothetical protein